MSSTNASLWLSGADEGGKRDWLGGRGPSPCKADQSRSEGTSHGFYYKIQVFQQSDCLFQIILDAKDAEEAEVDGDNSRSSVADCLDHIEARLKRFSNQYQHLRFHVDSESLPSWEQTILNCEQNRSLAGGLSSLFFDANNNVSPVALFVPDISPFW